MDDKPIVVEVVQLEHFRFRVDFPGIDAPPVLTDEMPPLGDGGAPNPVRLLAAGVLPPVCSMRCSDTATIRIRLRRAWTWI
ncbi:hypothetical protein [Burkholderia sp. TSV86]|uniref:hypothetical protein n=1 Tax=Burkholderia sp. TSV86 TaxID=1385594 RepID=UPI000A3F3C23|nr:hypothetical protein [Burkholderia sp. TSV86]